MKSGLSASIVRVPQPASGSSRCRSPCATGPPLPRSCKVGIILFGYTIVPDTHAFIGVLAQALFEHGLPIHLSTLGKILHTKSALPYQDGFDVGSIVAAAYAYWAARNSQTATAIAYAFRSENDHPIIAANEPPALTNESQEA